MAFIIVEEVGVMGVMVEKVGLMGIMVEEVVDGLIANHYMQKNEFCGGEGYLGKKIGGKFGLKWPKIA